MRQVATAARIYRIPVCLRKIIFSYKLSYQFVYFCLLCFGIFFIESSRYNSSTSSSILCLPWWPHQSFSGICTSLLYSCSSTHKILTFAMSFMEFTAANIKTTLFLDVTPCSLVVTYESTWHHVAEESISFVKILTHKCMQPQYMIIDNLLLHWTCTEVGLLVCVGRSLDFGASEKYKY